MTRLSTRARRCDTYVLYARRALASFTYWTVQSAIVVLIIVLTVRALSETRRDIWPPRPPSGMRLRPISPPPSLKVLSETASGRVSEFVDARVGDEQGAQSGGGGLGEALGDAFVPAAVTVINAVSPVFIQKLTDFERWDDERSRVTRLLLRMYLAKVLSAVDPSSRASRRSGMMTVGG